MPAQKGFNRKFFSLYERADYSFSETVASLLFLSYGGKSRVQCVSRFLLFCSDWLKKQHVFSDWLMYLTTTLDSYLELTALTENNQFASRT